MEPLWDYDPNGVMKSRAAGELEIIIPKRGIAFTIGHRLLWALTCQLRAITSLFGICQVGERVNLEADCIGKYAASATRGLADRMTALEYAVLKQCDCKDSACVPPHRITGNRRSCSSFGTKH
eukprot:3493411-Amphidinium_carterae.1